MERINYIMNYINENYDNYCYDSCINSCINDSINCYNKGLYFYSNEWLLKACQYAFGIFSNHYKNCEEYLN